MTSEPAKPGILVPLDGSPLAEQVLPYAQALLPPGGELTLLGVVEEPGAMHGMLGPLLVDVEALQDTFEQIARDHLRRAESVIQDENRLVRLEVARGDPAEQIVRVATELQAELIAMTTRGRGAVGRTVFGSVADRVARSAPIPVFLLRALGTHERPAPIRRVVVPLDGSALALEAVPRARTWAERLGVPIHLITAVDMMRAVPVELGAVVAFDSAMYEEFVNQLDAAATSMLEGVSEQLQREGASSTFEIVHGSPFHAIVDAVEDGDLVVMTSHGRSGVRRWAVGSVAEKLVREAPVPVILVPVSARQLSISTEEGAPRSSTDVADSPGSSS